MPNKPNDVHMEAGPNEVKKRTCEQGFNESKLVIL